MEASLHLYANGDSNGYANKKLGEWISSLGDEARVVGSLALNAAQLQQLTGGAGIGSDHHDGATLFLARKANS